MKNTHQFLSVTAFVYACMLLTEVLNAAPVVPGYNRFFSESGEASVDAGLLLLGELNCTSCHAIPDELKDQISVKAAPDLSSIGGRVRSGYLAGFIKSPQSHKPGTTMPEVMQDVGGKSREERINHIAHFLASTGAVGESNFTAETVNKGRQLFTTVGCMACHDLPEEDAVKLPTSVPFPKDLSSKYTVTSLRYFLEDPLKVRHSGRMPNLNLGGDQANQVAAYLLRDLQLPPNLSFKYYEVTLQNLPDFSKMKPNLEGEVSGFNVEVGPRRDNFAVVFNGILTLPKDGKYTLHIGSDDGARMLIDGQEIMKVDGIHPVVRKNYQMDLKAGDHTIVVEYFEAGGGQELYCDIEGPGFGKQDMSTFLKVKPTEDSNLPEPLMVDLEMAKRGKDLFLSNGCANCHKMDKAEVDLPRYSAQPLVALKDNSGCLSGGEKAPKYNLSDSQKRDLSAALAFIKSGDKLQRDAKSQIATTMTRFNCYACHQRDGVGGPEKQRNSFFDTNQKEMGDEARIPPHLTGVGDKLQGEWMKHVLENGAKDRPYMFTKMPRFSSANVGDIHELFAQVDEQKKQPELENLFSEKKMKVAGRRLVGSRGYSCVKCHTFGPHKATGVQAIALDTMTKRLKHDWFSRYIVDPPALRPGTRMPSAWPNGQVLLPAVLDGSVQQQVESIWLYLTDGDKAQIPQGLGGNSMELYVFDEAVIYRNFIQGAGSRAIGVGYPEKANVAFDANQMSLPLLWHGAFIDAGKHWTGRGQGYQVPLGDNLLTLPNQPAFAILDSQETIWPTGKPKENGYRFGGYALEGDKRKPTFLYSYNGVDIHDRPNPEDDGEFPAVNREFKLTSDSEPEHFYLRAHVSKDVVQRDDGAVVVGDELVIKVSGDVGEPILRKAGDQTEVLLPVKWKRVSGKFVAEIIQRYEW